MEKKQIETEDKQEEEKQESKVIEQEVLNKQKHKNLITAFCAFQSEVSNPINSKSNNHFNYSYAPLDAILKDVRPILAKHGLAVMQETVNHGSGMIGIKTTLLHESGETYTTPAFYLPPQQISAQGFGSAITYGRRYSLSAILGIAGEEDVDGYLTESNGNNEFQTLKDRGAELGTILIEKKQQDVLVSTIEKHLGKGKKMNDITPQQIQTLKFLVNDLEKLC